MVDDRDATTTGKVDASPVSPAARSRLAIFLGMVLGLGLLAAAWALSGGPGPG